MIEKYEACRIQQEIGRVLWEVWDPIGVNSYPQARDEYDSYVNAIYIMMTHGATDTHIASQLLIIATETMGLSGVRYDDMLPTVKALREISIPAEQ